MLEEQLGRHLNFLIIDSDLDAIEETKILVNGSGEHQAKFFCTASYDEALDLLREQNPEEPIDICILEYFIDGPQNGIEIMEDLMANNFHIPYIFLLKEVDPELFGEIMEAGATKCFFKENVSFQMLWMAIKKLFVNQ